jgi:hypothetical protein
MRFEIARKGIGLTGLFAAAMTALSCTPAEAAWQAYENEALGYSVSFPGEPTEGHGTYRIDLAPNAATDYAKLIDGDATYAVLVIHTGRETDGAILMGEFEYWLGHFGDIVVNTVSRLNTGMEYGRFISLDCRDGSVSDGPNQTVRGHQIFEDAAGISCPEGARLTVNVFFTLGKLYAVVAILGGPNARTSGAPSRFANSLGWVGENDAHAETLVDWEARAAQRAATQ